MGCWCHQESLAQLLVCNQQHSWFDFPPLPPYVTYFIKGKSEHPAMYTTYLLRDGVSKVTSTFLFPHLNKTHCFKVWMCETNTMYYYHNFEDPKWMTVVHIVDHRLCGLEMDTFSNAQAPPRNIQLLNNARWLALSPILLRTFECLIQNQSLDTPILF